MSVSPKSLMVFAVACTVAAAVFGAGSEVLAFRATFDGDDTRAQLVLFARLAAFVTLGVLLAFRGGWWGVLAALLMAFGATAVEWLLFPFAYEFAQSQAGNVPDGFPDRAVRPTYLTWALEDIIGVGICATLAQGLRLVLPSIPHPTRGG